MTTEIDIVVEQLVIEDRKITLSYYSEDGYESWDVTYEGSDFGMGVSFSNEEKAREKYKKCCVLYGK